MFRRILHLIHTPRHSGAEILVRDLCLIHQAKGIDTAIASFGPPDPDFLPILGRLEQARVRLYLPREKLLGRRRAAHFSSVYKDFAPDIIYGHSVLPALYGRLALPLFRPPDFVSVLHSATNDDYDDPKLRLTELFLTWRSRKIICVSDMAAQNYARAVPFARPVQTVPNGTNTEKIRQAALRRDDWRRNYGLAEKDRLILQVGRLCPVKQQLFTLESLTPLLKENSAVKIWFAELSETAEYEEDLRRTIARRGLQDQAKILGGREDVAELLSAADLYVMPSLMESQGIAMLEALASGVSVIASQIPVFSFLAKTEGVTLTALGDKEAFLNAAETMIENGRFSRDMSRFDIHKVAAIYGGY